MNGELNFEHVCSLLATDYIFMPTKSIYDKQISSADDYFNGYNIYFIGKFPNISPGCRFENSIFYCDYKIGDKKYPISIKIPNELIYSFENGTHYFKDLHGNSVLEGSAILNLVTETYNPGLIDFDVQYIGQSMAPPR